MLRVLFHVMAMRKARIFGFLRCIIAFGSLLSAVTPVAAQYYFDKTVQAAALLPVDFLQDLPSEEVAILQEALARKGAEVVMIDGVVGRLTKAAIVHFQTSRGEERTGALTPDQLVDLLANDNEPSWVDALTVGEVGARLSRAYFAGEPLDVKRVSTIVARRPSVLRELMDLQVFTSRWAATALASTSGDFSESGSFAGLDAGAEREVLSGLIWSYQHLSPALQERWQALPGDASVDLSLLSGAMAEFEGKATASAWYARATGSAFAEERVAALNHSGGTSAFAPPQCRPLAQLGAPRIGLSADAERGFRTGDDTTLSWAFQLSEGECLQPSFLIFTMSDRVRLSGEGFYALARGERAPFGIAFGADKLRVVVPLHLMSSGAGEATLRIYQLGSFAVDWAIVGPDGVIAQRGDAPLFANVEHGSPELVIQDPFSTDLPISTIVSPTGEFELRQYRRHFDIHLRATGGQIYTGEGYDAHFSPTGRFVHAFKSDDSQLQLVDVLSASLVFMIDRGIGTSRGEYVQAVGWSPGDTFMVLGFEANGGIGVLQTLLDRPFIYGQHSCGACDSWGSTSAYLDLENSAISVSGSHDGAWWPHSLAFDADLRSGEAKLPFVLRHVVSDGAPALLKDVENWDLNGTPRYTYNAFTDVNPRDIRYSRGSDRAAMADELLSESTVLLADLPQGLLRGSLKMSQAEEVDRVGRLASRLADFGVVIQDANDVQRDVVDLETGENYVLRTAEPVAASGLISQADGAKLDKVAGAWHAGTEMCVVMRAFEATLWSWTAGGDFFQIAQYICYESTGYIANGRSALLYSRQGVFDVYELGATEGDSDEYAIADEAATDLPLEAATDLPPVAALPVQSNERLNVFRPCGDLVAIVNPNDRLVLFDYEKREVRLDLAIVGADLVSDFRCANDGRQLLQINRDGGLFLRDMADGQLLLGGYYVDDELVWFDDKLAYDATAEGARYLNLKFPGDSNLYKLSQFASTLRDTDLIKHALVGQSDGLAPVILAPPTIAWDQLTRTDGSVEVNLTARSTSRLSGVEVFRDGALVASVPGSASPLRARVDIPVFGETRWLTIVAKDAAGQTSAAISNPVSGADRSPTGRLFYVGIGTDNYRDPRLARLDYAVSDASSLLRTLEGGDSEYYKEVLGTTLDDLEAFSAPLRSELARIAELATPEDTLILYISGHGVLDSKGQLRFAAGGTDLDDLSNSSMSVPELAAMLDMVPARAIVFLDVCHAGATGGATNDGAVEELLRISAKPLLIVSASKGRQFSREGASFGGGAFTSALREALQASTETDLNQNGTLELSEIYPFMKSKVVLSTGGRQTPWIARSDMPGEIPIY